MAVAVEAFHENGPFIHPENFGRVNGYAKLTRVLDEQITSFQHATSTVPMGGDNDEWAVVDGTGAVRGVPNLRVIDASILPAVPSVPTNLTVIMAAEHIYRNALA